jgi:hypothetical protein
MTDFLSAIEQSGFSTWVRESGSMWSYPTILFFHTVGLAFLVGPSLVVAVRLLGVAADLPLAPFDTFFRFIWMGFWINVLSGLVLLASEATTKLINPTFYAKLACVAVAMVAVTKMRHVVGKQAGAGGRAVPASAKLLAWVSIASWAGAIAAGRLMAYLGPGSASAPDLLSRIGG